MILETNPTLTKVAVDWANIAGKWTPAVYGGAGGALLGGLTTQNKTRETRKQRALRILRNATLGGVLGAGGAQAIGSALPMLDDVYENPGGPKDPPVPYEPGLGTYGSTVGGTYLWSRIHGLKERVKALQAFKPPGQGFGVMKPRGISGVTQNFLPGFDLGSPGQDMKPKEYLKEVEERIRRIAKGDAWDDFKEQFGRHYAKGDAAAAKAWLDQNYGNSVKNTLLRQTFPVASATVPGQGVGPKWLLGGNARAQRLALGGGVKTLATLGIPSAIAGAANWASGVNDTTPEDDGSSFFRYLTAPWTGEQK